MMTSANLSIEEQTGEWISDATTDINGVGFDGPSMMRNRNLEPSS